MAIYHLSGTIISRSQGRSAVAASAYRSGECLTDERYQKVHDYTRRQGVVHQEILLPKNASQWMADREKLWNAVEATEKRKDAQLSREFNFALPRELTLSQNQELARGFIQSQFVGKGMVADWCIHEEKGPEEEPLYHAHVMLTLREVTPEGFGLKVREWNTKEQLLAWREAWAVEANHHLALHGHDQQIDHRTLEAQKIALEPQHQIGPKVTQDALARLKDHQRIARENGERILKEPQIALKALTQQQSTFTHQDLARFVNRHTVDEKQFEKVYEAIKLSPGIVKLGLDEQQRERFTSTEMLQVESHLLTRAKNLADAGGYRVPDVVTRAALAKRSLSEEQQTVLEYLLEPKGLKCVIGYAGTGKSYLLGAANDAWKRSGFNVHGITLSGIAAESLSGESGIAARTYASHCWYWDRGEQLLGARDIVVVDEAGMLGSRAMGRIMREAFEGGAKVVLVGDPQQLQAIEAGGAFKAILERSSWIELSEVRRQEISWQREATKEFAQGMVDKALSRYEEASHIHEYATQSLAKAAVVSFWNEVRVQNPNETQIMLAYTRQDVLGLNQEARGYRQAAKELGVEFEFQTARGKRLFAENERIYFLKNERSLGVRNGSLGTILALDERILQIRLDKEGNQEKIVTVDLKQYPHLEYGYAATIHKTQGISVDRTHLLASRYCDAHAAYVGMTRHRKSVELFYSREEFPKYQDLVYTLSRNRVKDVSLDYLQEKDFAHFRGIERAENEKIPTKTWDAPGVLETEKLLNTQNPLARFSKGQEAFRRGMLDLKSFKAQFEQDNPVRAAQLAEKVRPHHEKEILETISVFTHLEKQVEKNPGSFEALKALKEKAYSMSKQVEVMNYLKDNNEALSKKIEGLSQSARALSQGIEKDFGRSL